MWGRGPAQRKNNFKKKYFSVVKNTLKSNWTAVANGLYN